ncbi:gamma-carboxygeranoyl-CoA hydratase [Shewanella sp. NFH-SH190041]|uniref:enoyl-CoA hydratase-related protein n=1 Tax=Shewanella sp. NFH-SH190041 TaxID=2950245 RepID=UPI0021C3759F|nr:enoyl-CoA hydratase-related protein [Shewanella sp. NFH-SH190041]BDM65147.1 gamma-carboxygeranoyl-CoA hydratase [Shewanella sp. NFH-SH190041]
MEYQYINVIQQNGVATLTLCRQDKHNAFDEVMIGEMIAALDSLAQAHCHLLVIKAAGKHFSAGADLNWMRKQAAMDFATNLADAEALASLMHKLDTFPHPTLALVNGAAFGGALGLICACDIAIAAPNARFCLSEVKLGLIPAAISPYVLRAMGERQARRYMLSAETFDAQTAVSLGIVHQLAEDIGAAGQAMTTQLLGNSPQAMQWCKNLIRHQQDGCITAETLAYTSEQIARIRVSEQGQEGLNAFFDKRQPNWVRTSAAGEGTC